MANEKRLIDANTLMARLASSSESWAKNLQAIRNWWPHAVGIKDNIVGVINDMPTVDAVEVVHGHWVSLTECANAGVYCSVCNKKVYKEDYAWCNRKNKLRSNYCPNCGAKMDGDSDA